VSPSEGLRQESSPVTPCTIRSTVMSPGAVATELPNSVTDGTSPRKIHKFHAEIAIPRISSRGQLRS